MMIGNKEGFRIILKMMSGEIIYLNQLINFRRDTLVDRRTKVIGQSAHALNLAWSFMEHAWGIKCGKMHTPMEIWNDEEHLKKGLNKILTGTFFSKETCTQNHRV